MKKQKPVLHDPLIIPRVKQYLEENVHQTYVNVSVMARSLQSRYREYERRKAAPFRALVEQAYKMVLHSYGLDSNPSSEDNGDAANSDLEVMDDAPSSNHMNDMLSDMYAKNRKKAIQNSDNDLIDIISSDESADEGKSSQDEARRIQEKVQANSALIVTKVPAKDGNSNDSAKRVLASFQMQPMKKRKVETAPQTTPGYPQNEKTPASEAVPALAVFKTRKTKKPVTQVKQSTCTFRDIGGMEKILKELCELLFPMKHPEVYHQIGISPPRGFLLHGPPGCGKTLLAHAIAGQLNVSLLEVGATELVSGVSGDSEERIRDLFDQAASVAPCVLFVDEIDAITSHRANAQRDMERRIVTQLISSLDNLSKHPNGEQVIVIGATTNPDSVDPALRRIGRFDHEISIGIPDRDEREAILMTVTDSLSVEVPFDYRAIAELTPGYVGADLLALSARAASIAVKRCFEREYRLHQAKISEDIPIVDLDAEDAPNEDENTATKENTAGSEEANVEKKDSTPTEGTAEASEKVNGEIVSDTTEQTNEEKATESTVNSTTVSDEKEANATTETPVTTATTETTETAETGTVTEGTAPEKDATPVETVASTDEKMDVDVVGSEAQKDTAKNDNLETTIDVDELPDAPEQSFKHTRRHDLPLFEMVSWLSAECPPISGPILDQLFITIDDFKEAVKLVTPSAKREGFITVPDVTWDDIGSLKDVREELKLAVLAPVKFPEKLKALGLTTPSGVLLCGPPGCGKTLIAKAIANEAGINFISVKGPELMNMYVGESEKAVRQCFQRARNSAPCVIFFDEFDSLCPKRSDISEGASSTRVVNQLLTEMDGIEERKGVFLMAASNRPDIIDPAVLRPGRLDKIIYIGLPNEQDRIEILEALTKKRTKPNLADDVLFPAVASSTSGFTGADLSGVVRQASLLALKDSLDDPNLKPNDIKVTSLHFTQALKSIRPSVSQEERKNYERLRMKYTNMLKDNE